MIAPRPTMGALLAVSLAAAAFAAPPAHAAPPSAAKAHGKRCQGQAKQRSAGAERTAFSRCVTAMARVARGDTRSPARACAGLSRRPGARGTRSPYARCVSSARRLVRHGNGVDLAYVEMMIPHHEGAIEMAQLALTRARTPFVQELARAIIASQTAEIRTLRRLARLIRRAGVTPASLGLTHEEMGMNHDVSHLVDAEDFDVAFATMMIPHHEGAIRMSRVVLRRGVGRQVHRLARSIIADQQREIRAMREFLAAMGAPAPGHGNGHGAGHGGMGG